MRDHDIEVLKNKNCMMNRYPLMDVSNHLKLTILAFCKEEYFLCNYIAIAKVLSEGLQIYAR